MTDHIPVNMTVMRDSEGEVVGAMSRKSSINISSRGELQDEVYKLQKGNAGLKEYADSRDESIKVYQKELEEEREKVREMKEALEKIDKLDKIINVINSYGAGYNDAIDLCKTIIREALGHPTPDKGK